MPAIYLRINHPWWGTFQPGANILVNDNDLINWRAAVAVVRNFLNDGSFIPPGVVLDFTDNRLGGGDWGVYRQDRNAGGEPIDAQSCWWGAPDGPSGGVTSPNGNVANGSGVKVDYDVLFDGFYITPTGNPGAPERLLRVKRRDRPVPTDIPVRPNEDPLDVYEPAEPTDWADPAPTTLTEAVDRLASVVKDNHGVIP
jgi:hypothetical protein